MAQRMQRGADGQAKPGRKRRGRRAAAERPPASGEPRSSAERIERRLTRIEEAVAAQSERSQELLTRLAQATEAKQGAVLDRTADDELIKGLERARHLRHENIVPVNQPLALICQAQRSGGTLLARLFDGHPQCHAHPHELHIGERRPHTWPELGLDEKPEAWFAKLKEDKLGDLFGKGRRQIPLKQPGDNSPESYYPFILPPAFQRLLFLEEVERRSPIESEREILDCYMTSLFNAWLDNQNLRGPEKRWVVAFSPRRAWGDGLERHFELYPDGRLISILRDPMSWYSSALGRDPEADAGSLLEHWKRSAREMLAAARRYEEQVYIVRFDELLLDTAGTMRHLADFLGIDYRRQLTVPTFNGYLVGANSSYEVRRTGVVTDPVERHAELLSEEQRKLIQDECEDLHREVLSHVDSRPAG